MSAGKGGQDGNTGGGQTGNPGGGQTTGTPGGGGDKGGSTPSTPK